MIKKVYNFITDTDGFCGRNAGKIVLGAFILMFLSIFAISKVNVIQADAVTSDVNEVRMQSIEYVFTFDNTVSKEKQESITNYIYSTIDATKLLHMVNMRQHVVFSTKYASINITEDTIYCPTNVSIDAFNNALDELE